MLDVPLLIGGQSCPARDGRTFERRNPVTGAVVSRAAEYMQALIDSVGTLSAKERKALAILLKEKGINLFGIAPICSRGA
ncbi:hypothetical protein ACWA3C_27780, partial [Pseudomonas chlororaphis]